MNVDTNKAKKVIYDQFHSRVTTAEAKLDTLKAQAETAKANVEVKAIPDLLAKKVEIRQKLEELETQGGEKWEQTKADLETRIGEFEKSVKGILAKAS